MKIGLIVGASDGPDSRLDGLIDLAKKAEADGLDAIWMAHITSHDAMMALALAGRETATIQLGTAVTATYPRHPVAMAQQALTVQAASNGRFTLGIGVAHQIVVENSWGLSYDKPARHMREYLQVLNPLLAAKTAKFDGDLYKVHARIDVPDAPTPVPLCIAALGPVMLKLAGSQADGTVTWMVGPKTIDSYIRPSLADAATEAGRPSPRIVAGFPMILTNKPDEARAFISKTLSIYGQLPSYRAMLDREGVEGPADISLIGDEATLAAGLTRLKEAGVTDFNAAIAQSQEGDFARTFDFLANWS